MDAGILSTMESRIFRSVLTCSIQASLFDDPRFSIMNLRIPLRHSPSVKMFAPVWADWTRRWWNMTFVVRIGPDLEAQNGRLSSFVPQKCCQTIAHARNIERGVPRYSCRMCPRGR